MGCKSAIAALLKRSIAAALLPKNPFQISHSTCLHNKFMQQIHNDRKLHVIHALKNRCCPAPSLPHDIGHSVWTTAKCAACLPLTPLS